MILKLLFVLAWVLVCAAEPEIFHVISAGPVYATSSKSEGQIHVMVVGSFVVGEVQAQGAEAETAMLQITFPLAGWLDTSACEKVETVESKHMCSGGKHDKGRAFLAGSNILGSCVKSHSSNWVNQWPVGGNKIGALVGGNLGAEIVPFSVADLFFINGGQMNDLTGFSNTASTDRKSKDAFEAGRAACIKGNTAMTDRRLVKFMGNLLGASST